MFLLCSGLISVSDGNDSKRLLLNDPTIFQDRLNRMESMLTILQNTVKQQAITIQQQDSKIQQQADAISKIYIILSWKTTDLDLFRSVCDSYLVKVGFDI
jgi:multidrug resistance efflux pump